MTLISFDIDELIKKAKKFVENQNKMFTYEEFLELNYSNYKNRGVVYFLYVENKGSFELKYVGKSKGKYFRQRMRNHFYKKHARTGSKLKTIQKEIEKKNSVKLNFITTEPESIRNVIEEELIKIYKPNLWNF